MKRIMAIVLLFAVMISCSLTVAAESQTRASELIIDRTIYAFDYGNGDVEFVTDINTYGAVDKLGFSSLKLQEKQGSQWATVRSATDKYTYNSSDYSYSLSYGGTPGNQYRFVVKYYAKDGDIVETRSTTSSVLTAKHS